VDHLKKDLQVELNTPVQHIDYPESGDGLVTITTNEGVKYHCKNVVITASPHVINNKMIQFSPPLPDEIEQAFGSVTMNSITKVIMKFSKAAWPRDLHGMIMVGDKFLLPEVWFRIVEDEVEPDEPATAYAVGFTTSKFAERLTDYSQQEVFQRCLSQLDEIFAKLEPRHMSANPDDPQNVVALKSLPKPSEVYLGGMFWDWRPSHHPYIGGGYCSPTVGKPITIGDVLKKGNGNHMFFAGEATNHRPGATAHAAMETGLRAADQVRDALRK
jgi:monoamine oxidase